MNTYKISWVLYIVGSLLVFGSWVNLVPTGLGWFGWLLALGGWALGNARTKPVVTRSRTNELSDLNILRQEGVLTEEEFQKEKARILREQ